MLNKYGYKDVVSVDKTHTLACTVKFMRSLKIF
jgi:hypothetical protein